MISIYGPYMIYKHEVNTGCWSHKVSQCLWFYSIMDVPASTIQSNLSLPGNHHQMVGLDTKCPWEGLREIPLENVFSYFFNVPWTHSDQGLLLENRCRMYGQLATNQCWCLIKHGGRVRFLCSLQLILRPKQLEIAHLSNPALSKVFCSFI
jgi:hypothetical protein